MDYWKLNSIIEKDKYLLPLINKTFCRISRVKVFTKLDIRYAFYRIYMHPDLKALTVFGMHYRVY